MNFFNAFTNKCMTFYTRWFLYMKGTRQFADEYLPNFGTRWTELDEGVRMWKHPMHPNHVYRTNSMSSWSKPVGTAAGDTMPHPRSREFVIWASNNADYLSKLQVQFAVWNRLSETDHLAIWAWYKTVMEAREGIPAFIPSGRAGSTSAVA